MTKTATKLNAIEHAQKIIDELQAKHSAITAAGKADDAEMAAIAFASHTGDAKAAAKLETLTDRALRREHELKSIAAAISVAQRKLAEAQQAEAAEVERLAATELLGLCKVLREAGQQADDALNVLGEAAATMGDTIAAINRLGVTHPSSMQLVSLGERSIRTALRTQPWARAFEDVPPAERRNFASFVNAWAVSLEQDVNAKINHLKQQKDGSPRAA
jgi:hypothetical protein